MWSSDKQGQASMPSAHGILCDVLFQVIYSYMVFSHLKTEEIPSGRKKKKHI